VDAGKRLTYKGLMISNVPNCAACAGYTNASWTLRAELSSQYVCRVIQFMDRHGYVQCVPRSGDGNRPTRRLLGLTSGYVLRGADLFPKQGSRSPWIMHQNYLIDLLVLRFGRVNDGVLRFSKGCNTASPVTQV
jgi:hypothetical protein